MKIRFTVLLLLLSAAALFAGEWSVQSPDQQIRLSFQLQEGKLFWEMFSGAERQAALSAAGIQTAKADFSSGLEFAEVREGTISGSYFIPHGKRLNRSYTGNRLLLSFKGKGGETFAVEAVAFDDGAAFRYILKSEGTIKALREATQFAMKPGLRAWMQPYDKPQTGAPAYEEEYHRVVSGDHADDHKKLNNGWCLPALFETQKDKYLLIADAGLSGEYHGVRLKADAANGLYQVRFPNEGDALGMGSIYPVSDKSMTTSWRLMISGDLADIFESTLVTDLSAPLDEAFGGSVPAWIKPGRAAWNWAHYHTVRFDRELKTIDAAAEMGWEYVLVDANWNRWNRRNPEPLIRQLVERAESKGVSILLWYNSGGDNNIVTEEPRNLMMDPWIRAAEMKKIHEWGVKGIKVDFFHSDKRDRIQQYLGILDDALENELLVNFHGCTMPRGWERQYPHLVTSEAVYGGEQYNFALTKGPRGNENLYFLFTRNVVGAMDYTPVIFERYFTATGNSYGHALSQAVAFESGISHYASTLLEDRKGYHKVFNKYPEVEKLMREIPAHWDESLLLAGDPDGYAVIARRSGDNWFVCGMSGVKKSETVEFETGFLGEGNWKVTYAADGIQKNSLDCGDVFISAGDSLSYKMLPYGGFTVMFEKVQ